MFKKGIVDARKVTRSALQNAASIAAMVLTTETLITDIPEKEKAAAGGATVATARRDGLLVRTSFGDTTPRAGIAGPGLLHARCRANPDVRTFDSAARGGDPVAPPTRHLVGRICDSTLRAHPRRIVRDGIVVLAACGAQAPAAPALTDPKEILTETRPEPEGLKTFEFTGSFTGSLTIPEHGTARSLDGQDERRGRHRRARRPSSASTRRPSSAPDRRDPPRQRRLLQDRGPARR